MKIIHIKKIEVLSLVKPLALILLVLSIVVSLLTSQFIYQQHVHESVTVTENATSVFVTPGPWQLFFAQLSMTALYFFFLLIFLIVILNAFNFACRFTGGIKLYIEEETHEERVNVEA